MSRYKDISKQIAYLRGLISKAEDSLQGKPEGRLHVCKSHGTSQFYHKIDKQPSHGKYLRKSETELIMSLAQKEYDQSFLRVANSMLKELITLQRLGAERSMSVVYQGLADVYTNLIPAKRCLVNPYVLPDEMYVENWLSLEYTGGLFSPDLPEIYSDRGERVRSKSEKMIADKLFRLGIPYRYEYPTKLKYLGYVYTDFTMLDIREREIVKYEHFGLMQDPVYCNKTIVKLEDYEKSGYHLGENFFLLWNPKTMCLIPETLIA